MNRENVFFTLIEPKEAGNIGAAARAIKNMGFSRLVLVNSMSHLSRDAVAMAHGAQDILDATQVYDTLDEALYDKSMVIGTTRRLGKARGVILPVDEGVKKYCPITDSNKLAVLFGRENTGLLNDEVERCGFLLTIPTYSSQPSLNLAQAVLIVAYEFARCSDIITPPEENDEIGRELVPYHELSVLYRRIGETLKKLGYGMRGSEDLEADVTRNIKHLLGRIGLTRWEINMLQGLCSYINLKIQREI
ncbi:MAG: RNA methyltransferase [Nitrospirae bacterium]|nr:RNA methyltransferase [Nitrospirota bacterium]